MRKKLADAFVDKNIYNLIKFNEKNNLKITVCLLKVCWKFNENFIKT